MFLNTAVPFNAYQAIASARFFVDKSNMYIIWQKNPRRCCRRHWPAKLKVDASPEEALKQIKDRNYVLRFKGKMGEMPKYTGRILAVGISYNKKTKQHYCKIEVLQNGI